MSPATRRRASARWSRWATSSSRTGERRRWSPMRIGEDGGQVEIRRAEPVRTFARRSAARPTVRRGRGSPRPSRDGRRAGSSSVTRSSRSATTPTAAVGPCSSSSPLGRAARRRIERPAEDAEAARQVEQARRGGDRSARPRPAGHEPVAAQLPDRDETTDRSSRGWPGRPVRGPRRGRRPRRSAGRCRSRRARSRRCRSAARGSTLIEGRFAESGRSRSPVGCAARGSPVDGAVGLAPRAVRRCPGAHRPVRFSAAARNRWRSPSR